MIFIENNNEALKKSIFEFFRMKLPQDYEKLGKEICENITKSDSISSEKIFKEFSKYYDLDNEKNDLLISDFNGFSFNLQKEIIKN